MPIRTGDLQNELTEKIHLQDWMEAWRKCLIYLNEQMESLEMIAITFVVKSHKVSLRPAHCSNTSFPQSSGRHPVKLSLINWTTVSWDRVSKRNKCQSLLVFYDASWKKGLLKTRYSLFLHSKSTATSFPKSLCSPQSPAKMFKVQQKHHIP